MDNDPEQITMWQFQRVILDFVKEHSMVYLDNTFVNKLTSNLNLHK
jgi:hypothetical protein